MMLLICVIQAEMSFCLTFNSMLHVGPEPDGVCPCMGLETQGPGHD